MTPGLGRSRAWLFSGALLLSPVALQAREPVPDAPPAPETSPETAPEPGPRGVPAAFAEGAFSEERVAVPAGTRLHERPHSRSPVPATVDAASELPLIGRDGGWVRVRYGARKGWVLLDPAQGGGDTGVRGAVRADPVLLAKAVARLGGEAGRRSTTVIGPWTLHTDLDVERGADLLVFLDRIAAQVPEIYRRRYGLESTAPADPVGGEAVVLFAREADYRAFAEEGAALSGLEEGGFAGFGIAALYAEERGRSELASLLVHELTHLLNARALGAATPPWLEEGLAEDLAHAGIGRAGLLDPDSLSGRAQGRGLPAPGEPPGAATAPILVTTTTGGARAALARVVGTLERGRLPPLAELTSLDWWQITTPALRAVAYAESAFFVRFLLDPDGGRAKSFREYLRSIAAGGPSGADALLTLTGENWQTLEAAFHRWLRSADTAP